MSKQTPEYLDFYARNNRIGGYPEYMEEYWLSNGYEWRDGLLRQKIDPLCLNPQGIPTNEYNLPAIPGMNMLGLNARTQVRNRYFDQFVCKGRLRAQYDTSPDFGMKMIPFIDYKDGVQIDTNFLVNQGSGKPGVLFSQLVPWNIQRMFKTERVGNIEWKINNGKLIIPKNGTYIFSYAIEVFYGMEHNIRDDKGKCNAMMYVNATKLGGMLGILPVVKYSISQPEYLYGTTTATLSRGDEVMLYYGYLAPRVENVLIRSTLNTVKL